MCQDAGNQTVKLPQECEGKAEKWKRKATGRTGFGKWFVAFLCCVSGCSIRARSLPLSRSPFAPSPLTSPATASPNTHLRNAAGPEALRRLSHNIAVPLSLSPTSNPHHRQRGLQPPSRRRHNAARTATPSPMPLSHLRLPQLHLHPPVVLSTPPPLPPTRTPRRMPTLHRLSSLLAMEHSASILL